MHQFTVSIIIPFLNAGKTLSKCIDALRSQTLKPSEIILVDNNSSDESPSIAKAAVYRQPATFKYVLEKRKGPSFARNKGVKHAKGEILVFTDADCIPHSNWLTNLLPTFDDMKVGAVAGRIVGFEPKSTADKFHSLFTMTGPSTGRVYTEFSLVTGGFPTANLAVRKELIDSINGFDEDLEIYSEDYDLCARIYKAGYHISYVPEAVVYHQHRNSLSGTWRQGFGFGKGHAILLKRHFERMVIIDLPKIHYQSQKWPLRVWLDMQGADKRLMGLTLLSLVWWPLWALLIAYLLYIFSHMRSRLRGCNLHAGFLEKWQMVAALLVKSLAMTTGRIIGAIRERVLCF